MLTLRVADLMRPCHAAVIPMSMKLRDAAEALIFSEEPLLIAVDDANRFAGVVAESAVIRSLLATPSTDVPIESILSRHVESASCDASLISVMPFFRDACHVVVPVIDRTGSVVGLLHRRDVVRLLLSDGSEQTGTGDDAAAQSQIGRPEVRGPHFLQAEPRHVRDQVNRQT